MRLKVCGMKHPLLQVAELEPEYMGFIFWNGSRRYFTGELPVFPTGIKKTGVFVDASADEVLHLTQLYGLDAVQLHGEEKPEFASYLRRRLEAECKEGVEIIKAFAIGNGFDFGSLADWEQPADFFLFDSRGPLPGGNGTRFDWARLEGYPHRKPFFLSGGIGPETLEEIAAIRRTRLGRLIHAIDINSGFEKEPGIKDVELIRTFKAELDALTPHKNENNG